MAELIEVKAVTFVFNLVEKPEPDNKTVISGALKLRAYSYN
jgi:hypothetical protein